MRCTRAVVVVVITFALPLLVALLSSAHPVRRSSPSLSLSPSHTHTHKIVRQLQPSTISLLSVEPRGHIHFPLVCQVSLSSNNTTTSRRRWALQAVNTLPSHTHATVLSVTHCEDTHSLRWEPSLPAQQLHASLRWVFVKATPPTQTAPKAALFALLALIPLVHWLL